MNHTPPSPGASGLNGRRLWLLLGLPLLAIAVVLVLAAGSGAAPTDDGPHLVASGGGEVDLGHVPHLTDSERSAIFQSIDSTIDQLQADGKLPAARSGRGRFAGLAAAGRTGPGRPRLPRHHRLRRPRHRLSRPTTRLHLRPSHLRHLRRLQPSGDRLLHLAVLLEQDGRRRRAGGGRCAGRSSSAARTATPTRAARSTTRAGTPSTSATPMAPSPGTVI